jgi:hypothetical protein
MNKEQLLLFMINEFEIANKEAMVSSGISEQEAEQRNSEYRSSITMLLSRVVEKLFEKNLF